MAEPPKEESEEGLDQPKKQEPSKNSRNTSTSMNARKGGLDLEGRKNASRSIDPNQNDSFAKQKVQSKQTFNIDSELDKAEKKIDPEMETSLKDNRGLEDEIEKRLYQLNELSGDDVIDRIRLLIARNSLRAFPAAVFELSLKQPENSSAYQLLVAWDILLTAWQRELSVEDSDRISFLAKAQNSIPDSAPGLSIIITTAQFIDMMKMKSDPVILASKNFSQGLLAASNSFFIDSEEYRASKEAQQAMFDAVQKDIEALLQNTADWHYLRLTPIWYDLLPTQDNLLSLLEKRIEALATNQSASISTLLKKIFRDYRLILTGDKEEEDQKSVLVIDSADEKPQADKPSNVDYLGRDQLVEALAPRLSVKGDGESDHMTIGLLGDWGIGKSSVIEQLKVKLDEIEDAEYLFGTFNAWAYEHTDSLQAGIAHEVISALTSSVSGWSKLKHFLYKVGITWRYAIRFHGVAILKSLILFLLTAGGAYYLYLIDYLIVSGILGAGSLGLLWLVIKNLKEAGALPLAKQLKTYLKLPSYKKYLGTIPAMQKDIHALCDICLGKVSPGFNRRLVFFVDDLDRCGVNGIVKTFEAVRLVLDIPWVTVVIAMDQRIALPALACHYKTLSEFHQRDPMSIARDYLAKVIHLPIRLAAPDKLFVARYLAHIWKDDTFLEKVMKSPEDDTGTVESGPHEINNGVTPEESEGFAFDVSPEIMESIVQDVKAFNINAEMQSIRDDGEPDTEIAHGFGDDQKLFFYRWLLKFNLRNPRQIKRLYNSYNLLWSIYQTQWKQDEIHWQPNMLGLLLLESINQHVPFDADHDLRENYRQSLFASTENNDNVIISSVDSSDITDARLQITDYQQQQRVNLLSRLEPFVLPAVRLSR